MTVFFLVGLMAEGAVAGETFSQARAAYEDRRLEEAFRYAREAVRDEPENVDAWALLGQLYYLRQDLEKAEEAWGRALKLAPSRKDLREALAKLQKEAAVEASLARSDTHPFVVRFAEGQVPTDLGNLRQILRDTHRLIGQQFEYFPDHPITVLLYDARDFEKVKGLSHQVAGLYDGKIRLPLSQGQGSQQRLQEVLWHEYTHALVHDLSKGMCPVWLNEGIATLQEARVRTYDLSLVRQAISEKKLFTWDQLWQHQYTEGNLELHYLQAYLVAKYLVKRWGWRGLVKLLTRLGQGYPMADALRAAYQADPADLEKEWRQWLARNL